MLSGWFPEMLSRALSRWVEYGTCKVTDHRGRSVVLRGRREGPDVAVRLHDKLGIWKFIVDPELYAGEAYMDGTLTIEQGTLADFLAFAGLNVHFRYSHPSRFDRLREWGSQQLDWFRHYNPVGIARRKVSYHYDLTGALFDMFLDSDRQYSCAYFRAADESLEQAQQNKKRHLAAKLLLRPGLKVLDIGSGWGGLAIYLAQQFDVEVTGLTLSHEQLTVSNRRAKESGLADRVRFKLLDYRQEPGVYDRIVTVGMFEHVGKRHYPEFFGRLDKMLADDGVALVHSIGKYANPGPVNGWVRKYIFPGTYVPTLGEVMPVVEDQRLWVTDIEILRLHYAETLRAWNERFQQNRDRVRELYDERFCRMWEFYLEGCEAGFRYLSLMVFQMQLAKQRHAVPLTRDYMFDAEHALAEAERASGERAA